MDKEEWLVHPFRIPEYFDIAESILLSNPPIPEYLDITESILLSNPPIPEYIDATEHSANS